jgi:hypothetical protein
MPELSVDEPRDTELPAMVVIYGPGEYLAHNLPYPRGSDGQQPMSRRTDQLPAFNWINSTSIRLQLEPASGANPDVPVVYLPPFDGLISIAESVFFTRAERHESDGESDYRPGILDPRLMLYGIPSEEIRLLASCFEQDLAPLLGEHRKIRAGTASKIIFEHLWFLFSPGDNDVAQDGGCIQAYQVSRVSGGQIVLPESDVGHPNWDNYFVRSLATALTRPRRRYEELVVECFYYYSNSELVGPTKCQFTIKQYDGEISIDSLPIYPLRYLDNQEAIRRSLAGRGSKYMKLTGVSHMYYEWITAREPEEVWLVLVWSSDGTNRY